MSDSVNTCCKHVRSRCREEAEAAAKRRSQGLKEIDADALQLASVLECSICMELMNVTHALVCGHSYCKDCIQAWFTSTNKRNCPMCRASQVASTTPVRASDDAIRILVNVTLSDEQKQERIERIGKPIEQVIQQAQAFDAYCVHAVDKDAVAYRCIVCLDDINERCLRLQVARGGNKRIEPVLTHYHVSCFMRIRLACNVSVDKLQGVEELAPAERDTLYQLFRTA